MRRTRFPLLLVFVSTIGLILASCARVDRTEVQAQVGAPVAARVEVLSIPYNANLPRYVVAVMPLNYGASGITSGNAAPGAPSPDGSIAALVMGGLDEGTARDISSRLCGPGSQVGTGLAAQLVTGLSRCGNISLIEPEAVATGADGTYSCKLMGGEVGPFIVRGTVTEFNETADLSEKKRGGSLGLVGAALGIAGAASGHSSVGWTGAGLAAANPTYQKVNMKRQGMVGMDLQLVDGRTRRIVQGYNASGTFTTMSATSGLSVFGIGGGDAEFAASALGQATRAAVNDAVKKTTDALAVAPR